MAVLHGIESRATLTASGEIAQLCFDDSSTAVNFENGWSLVRRRQMLDATPFRWPVRVFMPRNPEWIARIEGYVDTAAYPGEFDFNEAYVKLYTDYTSQYYFGYGMIADIGVASSVDDAVRVYCTIYGTDLLEFRR